MAKSPSSTSEQTPSKTKAEVVKETTRIEESLLYSSKGHFAASHGWELFHLWLGIPMVVLSAVAGASAFSKFDTGHVIAGVLSIIVAVLSAITTLLNPRDKASSHFHAGNNYDALMNKVRLFRVIDCWSDDNDAALTEKLRQFSEQKDKLNNTCAQIPRWAYRQAKKGIEDGEAQYAVDSATSSDQGS